ncbi:MAG: low molecular weight protein arginine phosphatase [Elusimicrobia bacterium]|nr:low molecular weight protein arginine phosphatase [Elusimicrobiota bacterium]
MPSAASPRRLLFVCTGNTCRSPMAQFLLQRLAGEAGLPWSASSAGVAAVPGSPLNPAAARALAARGVAGARHAARPLDQALLDEADAVYALAREHRDAVAARFPKSAAKVKVLREDAGLAGHDVPDPLGADDAAYAACAASIEEALKLILRRETHAPNHR